MSVTGTIPTTIGGLSKLAHLALTQTKMTGKVPTEIGKLSNLERISLVSVHHLRKEDYSSLLGMTFSFSSPTVCPQFTSAFTGSLPTEITNLSKLGKLGFDAFHSTLSHVLLFSFVSTCSASYFCQKLSGLNEPCSRVSFQKNFATRASHFNTPVPWSARVVRLLVTATAVAAK